MTTSPNQTLYQTVADQIHGLISEGTFQPGDRLPSVRKLHRQWSVSISTVLEAYRLLEDRGLIEARPQSGYFVKTILNFLPDEPSPSTPQSADNPVDTSLAFRVNNSMLKPGIIGLGAAIAGSNLLPIATLNRLMGQVLRAKPEVAHRYSSPQGCEELRHEVARRLIDTGCSIKPDQIVITNGTTEALYLSLKAVTKPGDIVVIESPTYHLLLETIEALHLRILELPTHPQNGISLIHFEDALKSDQISACVLIANFSNPLGSCMSDSKKKQLISLINRYNVPLIEDDIYGDLNFTGNRPKAIKSFDTQGLVLYCSSISKTLSPGLRIGWAVPGRYQTKVEQLKMTTNYMTAVAPQLTIAAFLANGGYDRHLRKLRRTYHSQMMEMTQAICNYFPKMTRVSRPKGGYILWIEMPEIVDTLQLYEDALHHNIAIAPGSMFSSSGSYRNCFRLNFGLPFTEEIHQAMIILGQLLHEQTK
ncbi:PLP-dependent aminotransferase family protein (plasmid) [Synechocystis sp. PCC 7339]|uniref:aminotransferase-like domain-containing protein n=1 Tax=Synechocystis sp. PCC 7339 TaxID=2782213 RepID=UPI001CC16DCF|nr:PLP-dependent aminotransferase family protein [Synechocystis sp. PCC 7339]UAJ74615.1 PLP-dependent aminotransferase family protein [Synechocystis sp. PCC 7339]